MLHHTGSQYTEYTIRNKYDLGPSDWIQRIKNPDVEASSLLTGKQCATYVKMQYGYLV